MNRETVTALLQGYIVGGVGGLVWGQMETAPLLCGLSCLVFFVFFVLSLPLLTLGNMGRKEGGGGGGGGGGSE